MSLSLDKIISILIEKGYTRDEVLAEYETFKTSTLKTDKVTPEILEQMTLSKFNNKLQGVAPIRDVEFFNIGRTPKSYTQAKGTARCSTFLIPFKNGQPTQTIREVTAWAKNADKLTGLAQLTRYTGKCRAKDIIYFIDDESVFVTQQVFGFNPDYKTMSYPELEAVGIRKMTVAEARLYKPETDSKGRPLKVELFYVVGSCHDGLHQFKTKVEKTGTVNGAVFNLVDASELFESKMGKNNYPTKPGLTVYTSTDQAMLMGKDGIYACFGTISNKLVKDEPPETSMNMIGYLTMIEGQASFTEE